MRKAGLLATAALLAAGCMVGGGQHSVMAPTARYPVSLSRTVRNARGEILKTGKEQKVADFKDSVTGWSLAWGLAALGPDKDVSESINRQVQKAGGDAIVNFGVEATGCAAPMLVVLGWLPFMPTCHSMKLTGEIIRVAAEDKVATPVAPPPVAAPERACDSPSKDEQGRPLYFECLQAMQVEGRHAEIAAVCNEGLDDKANMKAGKVEPCLAHGPSALALDKQPGPASEAMAKSCNFPGGPADEKPDEERRLTRAAVSACIPVLALAGKEGVKAADQKNRFNTVTKSFAGACGFKVARVRKAARDLCGNALTGKGDLTKISAAVLALVGTEAAAAKETPAAVGAQPATGVAATAAGPAEGAQEKSGAEATAAGPATAGGETPAPAAPETAAERRVSLGLLLGYGTDLEDTPGVNFLGFGLGVRAGYTLDMNLYLGGQLLNFFGDSSGDASLNLFMFGFEGGYDLGAGPVIVRPWLGLGLSMVSVSWRDQSDTAYNLYLEPGVALLYPVDMFFFGGDMRFTHVFSDPAVNGFSIIAGGGVRL